MADVPAVVDNEAESRFEVSIDGHVAELVYRRHGDRLVLAHTGVPDELEGRGVGGMLVNAAIECVDSQVLAPFGSDHLAVKARLSIAPDPRTVQPDAR